VSKDGPLTHRSLFRTEVTVLLYDSYHHHGVIPFMRSVSIVNVNFVTLL